LRCGGYLAARIVLGILAALIGGHLSDRMGRVAVLRVGIVIGSAGLAGVAVAPNLLVLAGAGVLVAIGAGAFLSVNWALISQGIPDGQGAHYYALANIATAGTGAMAGLFGPLADLVGLLLLNDSYAIAFFVGAAVSLSSLLPLHGEHGGKK
jgi:MFS family permease